MIPAHDICLSMNISKPDNFPDNIFRCIRLNENILIGRFSQLCRKHFHVMQAYNDGKFRCSMEDTKNWMSMSILNRNLLHHTVHHPTKFQASTLNPKRVRAVILSFGLDRPNDHFQGALFQSIYCSIQSDRFNMPPLMLQEITDYHHAWHTYYDTHASHSWSFVLN